MSDMMMPQIQAQEPAPVPGNAAAKSKPAAGEEENGKGFSRMLDESMEGQRTENPGTEAQEAASGVKEEAGAESGEAVADEARPDDTQAQSPGSGLPEEGKALPAGEEVQATLAGLLGLNQTPETGDADAVEAAERTAPRTVRQSSVVTGRDGLEAKGLVRPVPQEAAQGRPAADAESLEEAVRAVLDGQERARPLMPMTGRDGRPEMGARLVQPGAADVRLPVSLQAASFDTVTAGQSAAPLHGLSAAPGGQAVGAPTPALTIAQPLQQPGWGEALGERVVWMVGQKLQSAEIRLNPPQLGPIEVRVSLNHDQSQAHVSFTAQHAVVRDALDAALPRLRELFAEQGLSLAQVDVSDRSFAEQRGDAEGGGQGAAGGRGRAEEIDEPLVTPLAAGRPTLGMLDVFV